MNKLKYIIPVVILISSNIYAASLPTSITAIIASAPTILQVLPMSFGIISGNSSSVNSLTYILDTASNVTTSGGGTGSYIGNAATSASFTIGATAGQSLTIYVNNYTSGVAPGGSTVPVSAATCKYSSGVQTPCDGPNNALVIPSGNVLATSTLKVGMSITLPPSTITSGSIIGLGYTINVLYS